ncbi:hypothetical protein Tco_0788951 [Tanacetum coccineum]
MSKKPSKYVCVKGGAWERVDGALEYMPLNCVKRRRILPLLSSYSCLLEAVSEMLEIDANSDFMVTYNSDNDIVESSVNGRQSSNSRSNQQRNFIHATPSVTHVLEMANLSEDIQCAGSDTRPPMLDRTDFASWQQRIRLYCGGKENGVNILKSIDEGPFQMGTFGETLIEGNEGALHLGPELARVYSDLSPEDKNSITLTFRQRISYFKGFLKYIYTLINHYTNTKDICDNVKMFLEGSELTKEDRESQLYDDFEHFR